MNYYEHHLGDYAAATSHLSWDEDMAYTRLLRAYYHHERAIPDGQQYRLARAITPSQRKAVDTVLREFFKLLDGHWHQARADREVERFRDKQEKAKRSANARWKNDKSQSERNANAYANAYANAPPTHSEGNAPRHQTPDTIPVAELRDEAPPAAAPPARKRATPRREPAMVGVEGLVAEGVDPQCAADWLAVRRAKGLPLTPTAWAETKAEAERAGLSPPEAVRMAAGQGWGGFRAGWVAGRDAPHRAAPPPANVRPLNRQLAVEAENRRVAEQWLAEQGAEAPKEAVRAAE